MNIALKQHLIHLYKRPKLDKLFAHQIPNRSENIHFCACKINFRKLTFDYVVFVAMITPMDECILYNRTIFSV